MTSTTIIVAGIVAVFSFLVSWLVTRQKSLHKQVELETRLSSERDRVTERDVLLQKGAEDRANLLKRIEVEKENRYEAERRLHTALTRLEEQQKHHQQSVKESQESRESMKQEFSYLANEILNAKSRVFSEQHQERLETMLKPFREQLGDFRNKVEQAQKADIEGRAALKQQLETLHSLNQRITDEAGNLARALKGDKKLQGNWGELQVEKILENSGLIKGQEYEREANFKDDEGQNKRPDFVVYLPEGKHLIIDSKVSLVDYMAYVNAEDDSERESSLARHILSIRNHIKDLGDKGYPNLPGVKAPDFVFMFMPIEPAFIAAFQHDQKLFNDAFEQNIVVVTPTTLLATLRTVANLWTIERQNASARKLAERAGLIYDKIRVFVEKMERLDAQLMSVRGTYDEAMNTLKQGRGNLISQANEFLALGVRVKKELSRQTLDTSELAELPADSSPVSLSGKKDLNESGVEIE